MRVNADICNVSLNCHYNQEETAPRTFPPKQNKNNKTTGDPFSDPFNAEGPRALPNSNGPRLEQGRIQVPRARCGQQLPAPPPPCPPPPKPKTNHGVPKKGGTPKKEKGKSRSYLWMVGVSQSQGFVYPNGPLSTRKHLHGMSPTQSNPGNQPTRQQTNQAINQPANQQTSQPTSQPTNQTAS